MGVDDAVALTLLLCADTVDLVGAVSVGGNVPVGQATDNIGRCLNALHPPKAPLVARGMDQDHRELMDATHVFGSDGLGETGLSPPAGWSPQEGLGLYEELASRHKGRLVVIAIGPLTNLAHLLRTQPATLAAAERIIIMGGAVFGPGNITPHAEFNVYRDPQAAAEVLGSGLPITLVPLDVTRRVALDESHVAHLAASNTRSGQMLARMIEWPMSRGGDVAPGQFLVHDALAVGILLWPALFLQSHMNLNVIVDGPQCGRTKPAVGRKGTAKISVVLSVQAADFLERLLASLCHEKFFV
jgi:purine nucleosidase